MFGDYLSKLFYNLQSLEFLNKIAKPCEKFITPCIIFGIYASVLFFCLCCAAALFLKIYPAFQSTTPNSMGTFKQENPPKDKPNLLEIPILNSYSGCSQRSEFQNDSHSCCGACSKGDL